ncbi:MAG: cation:proton antiporter [Breznakibacter sp.]
MELYTIVIVLLAIAIGVSPIASKIKLPHPILLLAVGIAAGFIPGFNGISINPDVVFLIFLPPMLYDAAYNIDYKEFKANLSTISALAISLIFVTVAGIAAVVYYSLPEMTWPLAFVLGAILSPPDAIAASGVTKGLHLPHRTNTVLEGESLVNDASALVALRFAVAAVAGSSFVLWKAGLMFVVSLVGGLLVGYALWAVFAFAAKKYRLHENVTVSLNLMVPFVAYLVAEEIHVSGVIAVVSVGLLISGHKDKFSRQVRVQSKSIWDTAIFMLGGLIFILIGLEFPHILKQIPVEYIGPLIASAFLIFLVALAVRVLFVFWNRYGVAMRIKQIQKREAAITERIRHNERIIALQQEDTPKASQKKEAMLRTHERLLQRLEYMQEYKPLGLKECVIIGWSGMRGIVSLAAAMSLPFVQENGMEFPNRDIIVALTVVTVVLMLLIQGLGLPLLIKWLKIT